MLNNNTFVTSKISQILLRLTPWFIHHFSGMDLTCLQYICCPLPVAGICEPAGVVVISHDTRAFWNKLL
jgi:hypothetical protein